MKTCGQCKHWSEYNKAWSSGVCKPPKPLPIWASPVDPMPIEMNGAELAWEDICFESTELLKMRARERLLMDAARPEVALGIFYSVRTKRAVNSGGVL